MQFLQPLKLVLGCRQYFAQCRGSHGGERISAWQPPIAADMVDPFLKILPISPATKGIV
jgi:hypothetical protein